MATTKYQTEQVEAVCQQWWQLHGSDFKRGQWFQDPQLCSHDHAASSQCQDACQMVDYLIEVLQGWLSGRVDIKVELIRDKVLVALFQCLIRLLLSQNADGSWSEEKAKASETSYAIKSITRLTKLSITLPLQEIIQEKIRSAQSYLQIEGASSDFSGDYIDVSSITTIPFERLGKLEAFYAGLPHFHTTERWILRASLIEGYLFRPTLLSPQHMLYNDEDQKWLEYIIFVLASNNNVAQSACSTEVLFGLMLQMSLLYQIDSFMENIMTTHDFDDIQIVYQLVDEVFDNVCHFDHDGGHQAQQVTRALESASTPTAFPTSTIHTSKVRGRLQKRPYNSTNLPMSPPLTPREVSPASRNTSMSSLEMSIVDARSTLKMFVTYLLNQPSVVNATAHDRFWFTTELRDFFDAQTRQVEEKLILSRRFGTDESMTHSPVFPSPKGTYYRWAQTTGATSVGSPYIFAFMSCVLESDRKEKDEDCWQDVEEKYLVERMSQHLAVMCRIENDIGGIRRDRLDATVNSVNFPEFATSPQSSSNITEADTRRAKTLAKLAQHERAAWQRDFKALEDLASGNQEKKDLVDRLRVFTGFITLYGEIYIARDPWWKKADE